jgi:hypothetical protein
MGRKLIHTRDPAKRVFEVAYYFKSALGKHASPDKLGLERVKRSKPLLSGYLFREFRIVFHRAGPERIKMRIHAEIHLGKVGEMPYDLRLGDTRKLGVLLPEKSAVDFDLGRDIFRGKRYPSATRF